VEWARQLLLSLTDVHKGEKRLTSEALHKLTEAVDWEKYHVRRYEPWIKMVAKLKDDYDKWYKKLRSVMSGKSVVREGQGLQELQAVKAR